MSFKPCDRHTTRLRSAALAALAGAAALACLIPAGCNNSPYPPSDANENVMYNSMIDEYEYLDAALAYGEVSGVLANIVETPFQYHYLDRPYKLDPLLATQVPKPEQRKIEYDGNTIDATVYTIRLRQGVKYQDHPCFVEANLRLTAADLQDIRRVNDFQKTATREMVASDFVFGLRRTADPRIEFPAFSAFAPNLLGYADYNTELKKRLEAQREKRKAAAGPLYNEEMDEQYDPIRLDYAEGAEKFPFIRAVDEHAFEVVLRQPYPQILYWMTFTFFSPIPPESVEFFNQPDLLRKGLKFDMHPIGTGPYVLENYDPTNEVVLVRNKNFRGEPYPSLPQPPADAEPEVIENYKLMKAHGMLEDAGKPMPFIDRLITRMEKESIPRWNKFMQGYYDSSGIQAESFDQAVSLSSQGSLGITDEMRAMGIELVMHEGASIRHYAFNMKDPVLGGYDEKKRKLRQAISIAVDSKEMLDIFSNGLGVEAQHLIPPGIFGFEPGEKGMNPYVFNWDPIQKKPVRKSIDEARRLMAEAGYPNGCGPDGQRLRIKYPTLVVSADRRSQLMLLRKQMGRIGIELETEEFASSVYWKKIQKGDFQMVGLGWAADYPDPETFLILYYMPPEQKEEAERQNQAYYENPRFSELYKKMSQMENSPERKAIIREMLQIICKDAPGVFGHHSVNVGLKHSWLKNYYIYPLCRNTTKYLRIDAAKRAEYRRQHNQPTYWPLFVLAGALLCAATPAALAARRHLRER